MFLIFFTNSFQQETTGSLSPYVYSKFANHSLVSRTNVLTNVIGGVAKLPCAMLIDVWGRSKGFGIMTGLCTLGRMGCPEIDKTSADINRAFSDGYLCKCGNLCYRAGRFRALILMKGLCITTSSGYILGWIQRNGLRPSCLSL